MLSFQAARRFVAGPQQRRFLSSIAEHHAAEEKSAKEAKELWKKVSLFFALPTCLVVAGNVIWQESQHAAHKDHDHEEKEPVKFGTYIGVHNKDFPWGDGNQTLFFNPHVNHLYGVESSEPERYIHPITAWIEYHMQKPEEVEAKRREWIAKIKAQCDERLSLQKQQGKVYFYMPGYRPLERANTNQLPVDEQ